MDTGKITQDLKNEEDYLRFIRIGEYIDSHKDKFPDDEGAFLADIYDEMMQKKFAHPQCSQIANIELKMKSGILSKEWMALGMSKAQSMCSTAKNMGVPLNEWIYELYDDLLTFKVKIRVPSEYERQLVRELLPSPEQRMERRTGIMKPTVEEGITAVGIDIADLLNRYQNEMKELIDASNSENLSVIDNLRKEVNSLQARIEALRSGTEMPDTLKEISRVLDSSQYQYFLRNAHKLGFPVKYKQIARGQYKVDISVIGEEMERKAQAFIDVAEAHERDISRQRKTHLEGYEHVLDILCRAYSKESHMPCGLSRTGALSTLADKILEYASSQGIDWQQFDIESIDLFAKKKQIYTVEQASEAFNNFISHIEGRLIQPVEEEHECTADTISAFIADYDAVALIIARNLLRMSVELRDIREDAIRELSICHYYPNNLESARAIARMDIGQHGMTYEDHVTSIMEGLIRRLGGAI